MYRGGIRSMLAELVRQDRLVVTEELAVAAPKTKLLADALKELALDNVLIVVEAHRREADAGRAQPAARRRDDRRRR